MVLMNQFQVIVLPLLVAMSTSATSNEELRFLNMATFFRRGRTTEERADAGRQIPTRRQLKPKKCKYVKASHLKVKGSVKTKGEGPGSKRKVKAKGTEAPTEAPTKAPTPKGTTKASKATEAPTATTEAPTPKGKTKASKATEAPTESPTKAPTAKTKSTKKAKVPKAAAEAPTPKAKTKASKATEAPTGAPTAKTKSTKKAKVPKATAEAPTPKAKTKASKATEAPTGAPTKTPTETTKASTKAKAPTATNGAPTPKVTTKASKANEAPTEAPTKAPIGTTKASKVTKVPKGKKTSKEKKTSKGKKTVENVRVLRRKEDATKTKVPDSMYRRFLGQLLTQTVWSEKAAPGTDQLVIESTSIKTLLPETIHLDYGPKDHGHHDDELPEGQEWGYDHEGSEPDPNFEYMVCMVSTSCEAMKKGDAFHKPKGSKKIGPDGTEFHYQLVTAKDADIPRILRDLDKTLQDLLAKKLLFCPDSNDAVGEDHDPSFGIEFISLNYVDAISKTKSCISTAYVGDDKICGVYSGDFTVYVSTKTTRTDDEIIQHILDAIEDLFASGVTYEAKTSDGNSTTVTTDTITDKIDNPDLEKIIFETDEQSLDVTGTADGKNLKDGAAKGGISILGGSIVGVGSLMVMLLLFAVTRTRSRRTSGKGSRGCGRLHHPNGKEMPFVRFVGYGDDEPSEDVGREQGRGGNDGNNDDSEDETLPTSVLSPWNQTITKFDFPLPSPNIIDPKDPFAFPDENDRGRLGVGTGVDVGGGDDNNSTDDVDRDDYGDENDELIYSVSSEGSKDADILRTRADDAEEEDTQVDSQVEETFDVGRDGAQHVDVGHYAASDMVANSGDGDGDHHDYFDSHVDYKNNHSNHLQYNHHESDYHHAYNDEDECDDDDKTISYDHTMDIRETVPSVSVGQPFNRRVHKDYKKIDRARIAALKKRYLSNDTVDM